MNRQYFIFFCPQINKVQLVPSYHLRVTYATDSKLEVDMSFEDKKVNLEARISELDGEKTSLLNQIPILKAKLTSLRLEDKARSLENEISALNSEKVTMEEEISNYNQTTNTAEQQEPEVGSPSTEAEPTGNATTFPTSQSY